MFSADPVWRCIACDSASSPEFPRGFHEKKEVADVSRTRVIEFEPQFQGGFDGRLQLADERGVAEVLHRTQSGEADTGCTVTPGRHE